MLVHANEMQRITMEMLQVYANEMQMDRGMPQVYANEVQMEPELLVYADEV